jgi:hypothetical protein
MLPGDVPAARAFEPNAPVQYTDEPPPPRPRETVDLKQEYEALYQEYLESLRGRVRR